MSKNSSYITLEITNTIDDFVGDPLFAIGSFNNWNPKGDRIGIVPPKGETTSVLLKNIDTNNLELKITRGNWKTLNCDKNGKLLEPYTLNSKEDSNIKIIIEAWRDQFPSSTASPQVELLHSAFYFPKLDSHKKIWIYLPEDYQNTTKRYPVIYMHDGQFLFDEATAHGKKGPIEWQVDKTINASPNKAIVVAIESAINPEARKKEYLIHKSEWVSSPLGLRYLHDIVYSLKPYIDKTFLTQSSSIYTAIVGSSLGGLLSLYAGLHFPEVFGNVGVLSPSIWMDDKEKLKHTIKAYFPNKDKKELKQNYFFYGGNLEQRSNAEIPVNMIENIREISDLLKKQNNISIEIQLNPNGKHGARYWQKIFPEFYSWWHSIISLD